MDASRLYVVCIRSTSGSIHFIGPFTPQLPFQEIGREDVLFRGNFRLNGSFADKDLPHAVAIPKGGRKVIYGMEYTLYEFTDELRVTMELVHKWKETSRHALTDLYRNDKY
jgi:hypothetical protein